MLGLINSLDIFHHNPFSSIQIDWVIFDYSIHSGISVRQCKIKTMTCENKKCCMTSIKKSSS